jgi:hypothetical protein
MLYLVLKTIFKLIEKENFDTGQIIGDKLTRPIQFHNGYKLTFIQRIQIYPFNFTRSIAGYTSSPKLKKKKKLIPIFIKKIMI